MGEKASKFLQANIFCSIPSVDQTVTEGRSKTI